MTRRLFAFVVAVSILAAARPTLAQEAPATSSSNDVETQRSRDAASTRRLFVYTAYGVSAIGFGLSFVFLAQASSALSDREDIARRNGSLQSLAWQCSATNECGQMKERREDWEDAKRNWAMMAGLGGAAAVTGTIFLIAHYFESQPAKRASGPRLSPAVSHQEAGLRLQGSF